MSAGRSEQTLWSAFPTELLEPREMADADRLTYESVPGETLMERAGKAVAEAVSRWLGQGRRVLVLCGPGNNGGDGYVAARLLAAAGYWVTVAALTARESLNGDAAAAAKRWTGGHVALPEADLEDADLIVDALFGAGLSRDLEGVAKATVEQVARWAAAGGRPVIAVDVPSGIDGASGAVRGTAVAASETITFFRLKPGHVLMPGRLHCGTVTLADIGISPGVLDTIRPRTLLNTAGLWLRDLPKSTLTGHKYSRGHAVVMSGPISQTGAARLCARGALRIGAGLVTVATPADALVVHASALTAIMTRVVDDAAALGALLADTRKNAVILGPGLGVGEGTRALVLAALAAPESQADAPPRSVVLDADALTSFADAPHTLFEAIKTSGHAVVLTPHDGEFAKLFGTVVDVTRAKPNRTRDAAAISGAFVVLKGADTTVAAPDGRASIAASDAPWLATAGSGDVLSGLVAGLLAQRMAAFEAASAAVWIHAEAARLFGPGLIAEDLPEMIPTVLRDLFGDALHRQRS